jgi:5-methylcytosine-specific restriction endonuclease McrA
MAQLEGPRRLDANEYRRLCEQVLARDRWTCQQCGSGTNLHVHHIQFRSRSGADVEENLITVCVQCHPFLHEGCT